MLILLLAIERSRCSRSIRRTERVGLHKASFVVWLGATATLPAADKLQDQLTGRLRVDGG